MVCFSCAAEDPDEYCRHCQVHLCGAEGCAEEHYGPKGSKHTLWQCVDSEGCRERMILQRDCA